VTDSILYLTHDDVARACQEIDLVTAIAAALRMHAQGETVLPAEAHLRWQTPQGAMARSLNMPCYLGGTVRRAGTKVINASLGNTARGIPRASGVTLLFDTETARVECIMEANHISATRTACITVIAVDGLAVRPVAKAAVIGAGAIAAAHLAMLAKRLDGTRLVEVFDTARGAARRLCDSLRADCERRGISLRPARSAQSAIKDAGLVVTATTAARGYVRQDWLAPGALIVNVSLDDVLPEVVMQADHLIVDDWSLVRDGEHRLLGRMYREGRIAGPGEIPRPGARAVDGTLGDVVSGRYPRARRATDIVLVNPFGMAIEDVIVAHHVYEIARHCGLGKELAR
jgi:ornithine cyclodeaminase/alanine dehydrogenase-like protein (mu-crystallin family)